MKVKHVKQNFGHILLHAILQTSAISVFKNRINNVTLNGLVPVQRFSSPMTTQSASTLLSTTSPSPAQQTSIPVPPEYLAL